MTDSGTVADGGGSSQQTLRSRPGQTELTLPIFQLVEQLVEQSEEQLETQLEKQLEKTADAPNTSERAEAPSPRTEARNRFSMLKPAETSKLRQEDFVPRERQIALASFKHDAPAPSFRYEPSPWRWNRLGTSLVLHAVGLLLLLKIAAWMPKVVVQPVLISRSVFLTAPVLRQPATVKIVQPRMPAQLQAPPKVAISVPITQPPKPDPQKAEVKPEPLVEIAKAPPEPEVFKPAPTKPDVTFNAPESGSSVKPTVKEAARKVQTGGFGDPNGVRGTAEQKAPLMVATLGSFAMPAGPGRGNGTGGAKGDVGTVKSAGFGDGAAGPGSGDHGPRGAIQQAGFGGPDPYTTTKTRSAQSKPAVTPVEITFKPRPVYTDEGRKLHVEGEVVLEVVFTASGELRVQRVVQGLGHGLDEAALHAAGLIRFKPAMRDGQPYDSSVLVHINFQLAE